MCLEMEVKPEPEAYPFKLSNVPSQQSLASIKNNGQPESALKSTKCFDIKVDKKFNFLDEKAPYVSETGPGWYDLPPLVASDKRPLSNMKNQPKVSIGLPHKEN